MAAVSVARNITSALKKKKKEVVGRITLHFLPPQGLWVCTCTLLISCASSSAGDQEPPSSPSCNMSPPHSSCRHGLATYHATQTERCNMGSACEHPSVVSKYLSKEVALGHMLGPYTRSDHLFSVHVNRFGVIPKGHDTGRWRLITDLSFPWGHSVNDGIDPSLCSLSYSTVDEVADLVARLGAGALLAKVDIESAYRLIPVHPDDSALSWVWNRRVRSLLTQCCRSGFDEPQRFLMRWLTPWLGTCTGPVYHSSGITSMILSLWHLLAPVSAKSCCQSWIMNARLSGFPLQIINAMVLLPA